MKKQDKVIYKTTKLDQAVIIDALNSGKQVKLQGLGTFSLVDVPAKKMRHNFSNRVITVKARRRIKFKPVQSVTDRVQKNAKR